MLASIFKHDGRESKAEVSSSQQNKTQGVQDGVMWEAFCLDVMVLHVNHSKERK